MRTVRLNHQDSESASAKNPPQLSQRAAHVFPIRTHGSSRHPRQSQWKAFLTAGEALRQQHTALVPRHRPPRHCAAEQRTCLSPLPRLHRVRVLKAQQQFRPLPFVSYFGNTESIAQVFLETSVSIAELRVTNISPHLFALSLG